MNNASLNRSEPAIESAAGTDTAEIILGLLTAVDRDGSVTQRRLARDLGIALGLTNAYIKRAAKKGLIKISQVPTNRYAYYLTPKGFAEKSRLTAEFLSQSFKLFRLARQQYSDLLAQCAARSMSRLAICGGSDLAEIVMVCARDFPVTIVGVIAESVAPHLTVPVTPMIADLPAFDIMIIADLTDPQGAYDRMVNACGPEAVMAPDFLNVSPYAAERIRS